MNLNRQTFIGFILKRPTLLKTTSGISCVMLYPFQCEQSLNSIWTYTITTLLVNREKCLRWSLLQMLILAKILRLTFKMTCCTFVLLQVLLTGRLIRSCLTQLILICCKLLLHCYITIAKLLIKIFFKLLSYH